MTRLAGSDGVTEEMREFYRRRTDRHVSLVAKMCRRVADEFPEFSGLRRRAEVHDASKYEPPERDAYVWVTWKHKCKDEGREFSVPEHVKADMDTATFHHVTHNTHHPEAHDPDVTQSSLDKRRVVDATAMPPLDVAEMVCDWAAMSEEKGTGLRDWADKNVGTRWTFTDDQRDLIDRLVAFLEPRKD